MPHSSHPTLGRRPEPVETPGSGLIFTVHAIRRMQQRAITREHVQLVLRFGKDYHAGNGCTATVLRRRDVLRWRASGLRLEGVQDVCVIMSSDGIILTVEHVERRPRFWRAA